MSAVELNLGRFPGLTIGNKKKEYQGKDGRQVMINKEKDTSAIQMHSPFFFITG